MQCCYCGVEGSLMDLTSSLHILAPPPGSPDEERSHAKKRLRLLGSVECILRRVVGLEARLWLCSALAVVSVPHNLHAAVFLDLLRDVKPSFSPQSERIGKDEDEVARQVLRMLCDSHPQQVARLLVNDSAMLCRFFSGKPKRALKWFQNFAKVGEMDHQLGARALARYAFMHREASWHELVWKGDRSQAPATVASKPHYFAELNVVQTIENFVEHVPSFWYSEELRDSLEDGQFLNLDIDFFIEELLARMASDELSRVWQLLKTYLTEESFAVLCQRVLPIVSDANLLDFINALGAAMARWKKNKGADWERTEQVEGRDLASNSDEFLWLEIALSAGIKWETLEDAIFCNAVANHGRELFRLLQDEEQQEEARLLDSLLAGRNANDEQEHWAVRQQCLLLQKWEAIIWLALEAWLLFYLLSQEITSPVALERIMTENSIGFLRMDAMSTGKTEWGREGRESKTGKEERRRSRKRHRGKLKGKSMKKHRHSEDDGSESDSDLPFAAEKFNGGSDVSWRLSLDTYVIAWTKVDVSEHLVGHAFSHWLQWTVRRW